MTQETKTIYVAGCPQWMTREEFERLVCESVKVEKQKKVAKHDRSSLQDHSRVGSTDLHGGAC